MVYFTTLFHEIRHHQGSGHHHVICTKQGRLIPKGSRGCDEEALGSNGLEAILFKNLQRYCENCSESEKAFAGAMGDIIIEDGIQSASAKKALRSDLNW